MGFRSLLGGDTGFEPRLTESESAVLYYRSRLLGVEEP